MVDNIIHIVLAVDNNYAQHAAVVITSVMKNTKFTGRILFHIFSDKVNIYNKNLLRKTAENYNAIAQFYDLDNNLVFDNLFVSGHISKAAYFRLDIANILDRDIEKVVYLDVDLVVYGNIEELWNYDLNQYPIGAVNDYGIITSKKYMKQKLSVISEKCNKYFNSGVLLIDLKQWRKNKFSERILKLASNNEFPHHDQDALNIVFFDNWYELPLKWNILPPVFNLMPKVLLNDKFRKNAIEALSAPGIIHYAGKSKPWEFVEIHNFNDKYYEYLQKTEFKNEMMPKLAGGKKEKSAVRQMIKRKIVKYIMNLYKLIN